MLDFKNWFLSLSDEERADYAKRADTTAGYIHAHLINRRKVPRKKTMRALADASNGTFTHAQLVAFFHDEPVAA